MSRNVFALKNKRTLDDVLVLQHYAGKPA